MANAPTSLRSSRIRRAGSHVAAPTVDVDELRSPSAGAPIPTEIRTRLGDSLDADLSAVRIHDDPAAHSLAASLGARALTSGHHIWFRDGPYAPGSASG